MNIREFIYNNFLSAFENKNRKNIGVELEFPLVNLKKAPVNQNTAAALMDYLCSKKGFTPEEYDKKGLPVFVSNSYGDVLSFDNSFNNFEFSMEKSNDLYKVSKRFYNYFVVVQEFLNSHNHMLCGLGINPYKKYITSSYVNFGVYRMIHKYLSNFSGGRWHKYPDFPAYISSIQTHLDISIDDLPRAYTLFARMDFIRAILFSNSLPFEEEKGFENTICFRDYLWENSGFGALADNVGKVNGIYNSADDIIDSILQKSMFNRIRNGKYELFKPELVKDYFENEENKNDIKTYLSFKNVEITTRGTLEMRSDCAQPIKEAFAPAAFNLGILYSLSKAEELLNTFFEEYKINKNNATLRDDVIYNNKLPAPKQAVAKLLKDLLEAAYNALSNRNKNEILLLEPLFERASNIASPALMAKKRLMRSESMESIMKEYSRV